MGVELSIQECVRADTNSLNKYLKEGPGWGRGRMLIAVGKEEVLKEKEQGKDKTTFLKELALSKIP